MIRLWTSWNLQSIDAITPPIFDRPRCGVIDPNLKDMSMWDGEATKICLCLAAILAFAVDARAEDAVSPADFTAMIDVSPLELSLDFHDEKAGAPDNSQDGPRVRDPFAQRSWVWNSYGQVTFGRNVGELYTAYFGAGYNMEPGLTLNLGAGFIFADMHRDDSGDAVGGQLDITLRWHFFRKETWSLFADFSGGIVLFSREFPRYGTNFNFIWNLGLGATYKLNEDVWLQGGVRWTHISNGNYFNGHENPGYDGVSLWTGVMLPF
jgi:opacity protein-like surface antigen